MQGCLFIGFVTGIVCFKRTGEVGRERRGMTCSKGPRPDSSPGHHGEASAYMLCILGQTRLLCVYFPIYIQPRIQKGFTLKFGVWGVLVN